MQARYPVGQFVLERRLSEGAAAEVWLARNSQSGVLASVRFLREPYAGTPEWEARFLAEGQRQAGLDHPNIVKVFGLETQHGRNFLIQQFIDGETLDLRIRRNGPMTLEQALPVAYGVLLALEAAPHGDLRPAHILIDRQGFPHVSDFGSPSDPRVDVNAFGNVLRAMLAGPPIPLAIQQVILRCTADDPAQRYANCGQVRAALSAAAAGGRRSGKKRGAGRWFAAAAALAGLAGVGLWPRQPVVQSFVAMPPKLVTGQSTVLTWDVRNANEVEIAGLGVQPAKGSITVTPSGSTVYALTGRNRWKHAERDLNVSVTPALVIQRFELTPSTVRVGEEAMLTWEVTGAAEVTIGGVRQPASGRAPARERVSSTFTLRATGADGTVLQRRVALEVLPAAAPEIVTLAYSPDHIAPGGSTVLRWEVRGATRVLLNGKEVAAKGEFARNQMTEGKYSILVAEGPGGMRVTRRAEFFVDRKPAFRIERFQSEPLPGGVGNRTELRYDAPGAARLSIQPEVGSLSTTRGSVVVNPARTTRYTLTAVWPNGQTETRAVEVFVLGRR